MCDSEKELEEQHKSVLEAEVGLSLLLLLIRLHQEYLHLEYETLGDEKN